MDIGKQQRIIQIEPEPVERPVAPVETPGPVQNPDPLPTPAPEPALAPAS